MAYKMYPHQDKEYLLKDFELLNPSKVVFLVQDSDAGEDLCFKLEQDGVYESIRDASTDSDFSTESQILKRMLPVLQRLLGDAIQNIRAVGILNGVDDVWMHLEH